MLSVTLSEWPFKIMTLLLPGRFNNFYAESTVSDPIIYTFEDRLIVCCQPAVEVRQSRALHPTPPSKVADTALDGLRSIDSEHIDEHTNRQSRALHPTPPSEVADTALDGLRSIDSEHIDEHTKSPLPHTKTVLANVTNDPSTADRTAAVPPARTPPRLKRKSSFSVASGFSSPSFIDDMLPTVSPLRDTSIVAIDMSMPSPSSPCSLALFPDASRDTAKPTTAQIRPKPHSAYQLALTARGAAEAKEDTPIVETATNSSGNGAPPLHSVPPSPSRLLCRSPTLPVRAAAEAKEDTPVVETQANSLGDGAPPSHSVPPSPSPSRLLCHSPTLARPVSPQATSDVIDGEDHGGRRRRKLTALGVIHAKEIEEKNERAAARKKADEEKATVRGKSRGARGRGQRRGTK